VSTNTVKTHVKRIYIKLGVSSRMEAIAEARRLGIL
jgi:LuxR family maltose regulon positive regulatory protein